MRIMVTGGQGQLGFELGRMLRTMDSRLGEIPACYRGAAVAVIDVAELDITCKEAVEAWITSFQPDLVIHCAAYTNVDRCETDRETARKVNVDGALYLAAACEKLGAVMVQVSTDYVFRGDASIPYREDDPTDPATWYGVTKRDGEEAVRQHCSRAIIARTAWLYGIHGNNFVKTIRRIAGEKEEISVVDDQRGNPTHVEDLAYHILLLAAANAYGTYHVTCQGDCTWYDFACEIVRLSGIACRVLPCTSEDQARPAPRPHWSVLDHGGLRRTVGDHTRSWKDALEVFIQELAHESASV